jgi:hypothetical protein
MVSIGATGASGPLVGIVPPEFDVAHAAMATAAPAVRIRVKILIVAL